MGFAKIITLAAVVFLAAVSVSDRAVAGMEGDATKAAEVKTLPQTTSPILTAQRKRGCTVRTGPRREKIPHGATYCVNNRLFQCDDGQLVKTDQKC